MWKISSLAWIICNFVRLSTPYCSSSFFFSVMNEIVYVCNFQFKFFIRSQSRREVWNLTCATVQHTKYIRKATKLWCLVQTNERTKKEKKQSPQITHTQTCAANFINWIFVLLFGLPCATTQCDALGSYVQPKSWSQSKQSKRDTKRRKERFSRENGKVDDNILLRIIYYERVNSE